MSDKVTFRKRKKKYFMFCIYTNLKIINYLTQDITIYCYLLPLNDCSQDDR